ncbi:MAG: hypothetical protein ACI97K_003041 [Glaciecola sp.]|jgi:hypothetical protein
METKHQERVDNTKTLLRKLVSVAFVLAALQFAFADSSEQSSSAPKISLSSADNASSNQDLLTTVVAEEPLTLRLELSFNIDLGEQLNKLVREIISIL